MLAEALLALTIMAPRVDAGLDAARARASTTALPSFQDAPPPSGLPYFSAVARAVSNWREETGAGLMPRSLALVARYSASDPAFVARCVKLNNYWCIKQAGWSGELGGDAEGHTGFATAADGADAAAQLLRRYYRLYNRRTALAIVRRWAPAECGSVRPVGATAARSPQPSALGGTLRARYLAHHAPGGAPRRAAAKRIGGGGLRVQPWSALARMSGRSRGIGRVAGAAPSLKPVADIATGIGGPTTPEARPPAKHRPVADAVPAIKPAVARTAAPPLRNRTVEPAALLTADRLVAESAALPSIVAGLPGGSLLDLRVPAPFCSNDETRIRNYASRIAASVGLKPDDDLGLFEADGTPSPRLALVMLAMSSVELGSLRASPALVEAAIARLTARTMASATATRSN